MTDRDDERECPIPPPWLVSENPLEQVPAQPAPTQPGTAQPSTADPGPEYAEVLQTILQSLSTLSHWVENVNAHLVRLYERPHGREANSERELLKEELDHVLTEIARVKSEAENLEAAELRRKLGKLRIKQTKILLRMGSNPSSDSKEDDLFGLLH